MSKKNGGKVRLSVKAVAALELLGEAKKQESPFQELDLTKEILRNLMEKDLITESPGIDGTVKYCITGRGQALLKSQEFYTFNPATRGNGRKRDCESCEHRMLLVQVKERCPEVQLLAEKMQELAAMKGDLVEGLTDDMGTVRDMYLVVTQIDEVLARLEEYGRAG